MEKIINQFVNSLPFELHLSDPLVGKYSACGPGTYHEKRVKDFLRSKDVTNIFKNDLDEACFRHDIGYHKHKTVAGRQPYDKRLIQDTQEIMKSDLDGYQRGYAALINKFFKEKIGSGVRSDLLKLKNAYYDPARGYTSIDQLHRITGVRRSTIKRWLESQDTYQLHKPAFSKFPTRRVLVHTRNYLWQSDLLDMEKFSKCNNDVKYLLTIIDVFTKYAWVYPLKNKTANEVTNAFKKLFRIAKPPVKIQTDAGVEFISKKTQALFKENKIHWFKTYNETKAQIVERFNRTLKTKIYRYFTAQKTYRYIDALSDFVHNYNNSYHRSIKMTPVEALDRETEVRKILYADISNPSGKSPFGVGDKVRISKYKGQFRRGFTRNYTDEVFIITEVLETSPVTYKLKDSKGEAIIGSFYKQELSMVRK